jgi:aconitate hydratase
MLYAMDTINTFRRTLTTPLGKFSYYHMGDLYKGHNVEEFPFSVRILLENIIRNFNGSSFNETHLDNILNWHTRQTSGEIPFLPARVLMQDFTGVPSIVDIASIRSEVYRKGGNPGLINPQVPVDLIIDHSVQVDFHSTLYAFQRKQQ